MAGTAPHLRAVLVGQDHGRSRRTYRTSGWAGHPAVLRVVERIDAEDEPGFTTPVVAFFRAEGGGWAILSGGDVQPSGEPYTYRRDALVVDVETFARLRCNPFAAIRAPAPGLPEPPETELSVPPLPVPGADDERARLEQLRRTALGDGRRPQLERLLAAVLDAERTLLTGRDWRIEDIELVLLLLPPSLRGALTFCAGSAVLVEASRVVLAPDPLEAAAMPGVGGHRLPGTEDRLSKPALATAEVLLDLLDTPARLATAHDAFDELARQADLGPTVRLLEEAAAMIRLEQLDNARRQMQPGSGMRILDEARHSRGTADHPEVAYIADRLVRGFPPEQLGQEVAAAFRDAEHDLLGPRLVLERALALRGRDPQAFASFARGVGTISAERVAASEDDDARRYRTAVALLAAARGNVPAMLAAGSRPLDPDFIKQIGGADAWAGDRPALVTALRGLAGTNDAAHAAALLRAWDGLATDLTLRPEPMRGVHAAIAAARYSLRHHDAEEWRSSTGLIEALLRACDRAGMASRQTFDRRPDADRQAKAGPFSDTMDRPIRLGRGEPFADYGDAELFLGLLGVEWSPCRIATWEVDERGEELALEVLGRVRAAAGAQPGSVLPEAVHWALGLLDRVRHGELAAAHTRIAVKLLVAGAGSLAEQIFRDYVGAFPGADARILADADARRLLSGPKLADFGRFAPPEPAAAPASVDSAERRFMRYEERHRTEPVEKASGNDGHSPSPAVSARPKPASPALGPASGAASPAHGRASETVSPALGPASEAASPVLGRASKAAPPVLGLAAQAASPRQRRPALAVLTLAGGLTIGAVLGVLVLRPYFGAGVAPREPAATTAEQSPTTDALLVAADDGRLREAQGFAAGEDWASVVALLSQAAVDRATPSAFTWDSLLAHGALLEAARPDAPAARRSELLAVAHDRASRALAASPFAPGADAVRLLRAEACLSGLLACDEPSVSRDLVLAARSPSPRVSERAVRLLAQRAPIGDEG